MRSQLQVLWRGVYRGVKFGALTGFIIWFITVCVCAIGFAIFPEARHEFLADIEKTNTLSMIGGFLAPIGLFVLYGAVPGAIIMAVASLLTPNRNETPDSN